MICVLFLTLQLQEVRLKVGCKLVREKKSSKFYSIFHKLLALIFDHLQKSAKNYASYASYFLLHFLIHPPYLCHHPEQYFFLFSW